MDRDRSYGKSSSPNARSCSLTRIAQNRRSRNIYDGANESTHAQINLEGFFVRDLPFSISLSFSFLLLSRLVFRKAFLFFFKLMLKESSSFRSTVLNENRMHSTSSGFYRGWKEYVFYEAISLQLQ